MLSSTLPVLLLLLHLCLGANIEGPWDIDFTTKRPHSCRLWAGEIRRAYDEAAEMAEAAVRDLDLVTGKRPDFSNNNRRDYETWQKVERTMLNFFGFTRAPDDSGEDDDDYMKKVQEVFKPMDETLNGNEMKVHYEMPFQRATITCGDEGWRYLGPDDTDPGDPDRRELKVTKPRFRDTGAWYWESRYLWIRDRTSRNGVNLCRGAAEAVTVHAADMIVLCKGLLDEGKPVINRAAVKEGAALDGIKAVMSFTLVHEFAHFFGAWGDPTEDDWLDSTRDRKVKDQQAVNEDGVLQYIHPDPKDFFGFTDQPKTKTGRTTGHTLFTVMTSSRCWQ